MTMTMTTYSDEQISFAADCADAGVPVLSARWATRREIARELRGWYPLIRPTRRELTAALNRGEGRLWRRRAAR